VKESATTLLQYGAIGAVLAVLLTLFVWIAHRVVKQLEAHFERNNTFMIETVKVLQVIAHQIDAHGDRLKEVHDDITAVTRLRSISSQLGKHG